MLWRLVKNILLLGVVLALAVYFSSGSLTKWQEVKERLFTAMGKYAGENQQVNLPAPSPEVNLDQAVQGETKEVTLYFTDAKGQFLYAEKRRIPKVEGIAKETLQALIDGPAPDSGMHPVIPTGVKVLGINVRADGLCIVDFSKELAEAKSGKIAVDAIVDTLTQFPTIQRVKILINGQEKDTLAGSTPISGELMRDESVIKQSVN